jgi:hypothetical protein
MALPNIIEKVRDRPGMYVGCETFDGIVAFISGYDAALLNGFLVGFREWLIVRANDGSNLAWDGILTLLLSKSVDYKESSQKQPGLFRLLEEFWAARNAPDGLRRIYMEYEKWLLCQEWYTPQSPHWVSPAVSRDDGSK